MFSASNTSKIAIWSKQHKTTTLLIGLYLLILGGRLYLTTQAPINSTDLMRYIGYGKEFWKYGLTIYNYAPRDFGDTPYSSFWPNLQFIYPSVAMLFFAGVAAIWPSLFFARLVLTLIELLNSYLITRLTKSPLYGLFYFLNPVSIWWVSSEGQFEPVVTLLVVLACLNLINKPTWAYVWLALAIQAKYWPGVLLPYFLKQARQWRALFAFGLAFIPSLLFTLFSVYIFHIIGNQNMASGCNPFYWDITDDGLTCWTPMWHLIIYAIATYGILLTLLVGLFVDRHNIDQWPTYVGLLMFVIYYKSISWAAAWYFPIFITFALPIKRPWVRWVVLLLSFAEPIAWAGLFGTPIGWINPEPPAAYIWGGI